MSIVNDALKKAGKGLESKDQNTLIPIQKTKPTSDKKWITVLITSFVIIASFFGSWVLYKNMSVFNYGNASNKYNKPASAIQSTLNNIEQNPVTREMKSKDIVRLNGIVYGNEGKWAIINDRIVKEGDKFSGGEITSITRDLVKIEKKDGSEFTLSLK
ncbi:MAG: hypothetical protein NTV71_01485 [Candidatus Omnitrophica bacterium]|nr:hypothetical protein [Candidatus Omnitrophota bacterium]